MSARGYVYGQLRRATAAAMVVAVLLPCWAQSKNADANSPPPIAIDDYVRASSLDGDAAKQFVLMRCAALYVFFAGTLEAGGNSPASSVFVKAAAKFMAVADGLEKNRPSNAVLVQTDLMKSMYLDRAKLAKARTGSWSGDKIISADGVFCKRLAE